MSKDTPNQEEDKQNTPEEASEETPEDVPEEQHENVPEETPEDIAPRENSERDSGQISEEGQDSDTESSIHSEEGGIANKMGFGYIALMILVAAALIFGFRGKILHYFSGKHETKAPKPSIAELHKKNTIVPSAHQANIEQSSQMQANQPAQQTATNDGKSHTASPETNDGKSHTASPETNDGKSHTASPETNDGKSHTASPETNDGKSHTASPETNDAKSHTALPETNDAKSHTALPETNDAKSGTEQPIPLQATQPKPMAEDSVKMIVKDYILNNPEVIMESLTKLKKKADEQKAKQSQEYLNKSVPTMYKGKPFIGNKDGTIRIIEFFDYRCVHCNKVYPNLVRLIKAYPNLKIALIPLPFMGPSSIKATRFSLAVNSLYPNKFRAFHSDLIKIKTVDDESIFKLIKKYKLNKNKLIAIANSDKVERIIKENLKLAQKSGVQGVPSFVINGEFIPGAASYGEFKKKIDMMIKTSG